MSAEKTEPDREELEAALRDALAAWDSLRGNRNYSQHVVQDWLVGKMAPAFRRVRNVLGVEQPDA